METESHHPSVSSSMQGQSPLHSARHSEPRRHPRSPPECPAHPQNRHITHTEKCQCTLKPISTGQNLDKQLMNTKNLSARRLTGGNQSLRTQTPPAQAGEPALKPPQPPQCLPRMPPRVSPYLPCTSTPNPAHCQKDQNEWDLISYKIKEYL